MSFVSVARDGRIAQVTFSRGDGRNALSAALMTELTETARTLSRDTTTSAIILTGDGAFSAGADLKDPAMAARAGAPLIERREMLKAGPDLCDAWESLEQTTICAIEGFCIGGALSLAVACDFRIIGAGAHVRLPEVPIGMNMSWRTLPRLVTLIGPARAKKLTLFGEKVEAEEAERWGLVDLVTNDGDALKAARGWAEKIAALPPVPVRMAKAGINGAATALHRATSFMDLDQFALAATTDDHAEAIRAFLEKRAPTFKGD
ncbi:MAG: enoyl-CoA hydratase/isomerase [Caulobacteraceae bacterium]|nr:MAG: enoyl-CoA hydratase/isomerase [Caulobacteraceae bacterium]